MDHDPSGTPGIDRNRVTAWLTSRLDLVPPLAVQRLAGGRSNLTYRVTDAVGRRIVLRRPPLGELPRTAHDVLREGRLLRAVGEDVPVPNVLAECADTDVTGAPFIVVEFLDGAVLRDPESASSFPEANRAAVGPALIDAMVSLHAVDPARLGLGDLAARRDFTSRQLHRWEGNWQRTRSRELPDLARTHAWLVEHIPEQRGSSIVHGDFRVDNCILDREGRVLGILDWELTTIGDPLADLGQLLVYWAEPDDDFTALHSPPTVVPGYATRDRLKERYLAASGADPRDVDFFVTFSWWKTACILENVYSRMRSGAMGATDRTPESFGEQARSLAARALRETTRIG